MKQPKDHPHSFYLKLWFAEARASGWGIVGLVLLILSAVVAPYALGVDLPLLRRP